MHSLTVAAVGSCLLFAVPAVASSAGADQKVSVTYSDLDFSKDGDRRRLDSRVRKAASQLCFTGGQVIVSDSAAMSRCVAITVTATKPQVDRAFANAQGRSALAAAALVITLP